jgi:serine phosphatase RsbU (regulator of sigma subunit)
MFGNERLLHATRDAADKPAKVILDRVFEFLNNFRHPLGPDDDETLVVIKVL